MSDFRSDERKHDYLKTCRHFNGIQHKVCQAGVRYEHYPNRDQLLPCLPLGPKPPTRPVGTCDKFEPHTEADYQAREAKIEASMEKHRKAGPVIAEIRKAHKGQSARGEIPCPACERGRLSWAISGYNGHMRGKCSTSGCLCWIE